MTKQFILTGDVQYGKQYQITDTENNYAYKNNKADKQKLCDLINNLFDENKQLKKCLKELKDETEEYNEDAMSYQSLYESQKRINEFLKHRIEVLDLR